MNPQLWPEIEQLYLLAAEQPLAEREAILATASCEEVRTEVASLLEADERDSIFLEAPPAYLAADLLDKNPGQLSPGQIVASFEVIELVSVGGMGEVYKARDTRTSTVAALKLLTRQSSVDPAAASRFHREALAASSLTHPNIVTVYEFGSSAVGEYIAMEWVEGQNWRALFQASTIRPINDAIRWASQAAHALSAAHQAGIVHRDIKPDNLMLNSAGEVKILDFGLARLVGYVLPEIEGIGSSGTISGTLSGTLPYMSPEVLLGERASAASDVFSFASVLYELFTGLHPFAGETPLDIYEAIESRTPEPPSHHRAELPPLLDTVLLSMLDRDPNLRPTSEQIATKFDELRYSVS